MIHRSTNEIGVYPTPQMPRRIADIGGGPGHYTIHFLEKLPRDWTAIVLDCYAEAGWLVNESSAPLRNRIQVINARMEHNIPTGVGVYILGSVLHNLDDQEAQDLLQRCALAAGKHSEVIIIERIWDPNNLSDSSRDIDMRILFGGRERTNQELADLVSGANVTLARTRVTTDGYRIFYGVKSGGYE
jgi:hypothetical protein